MRFTLDHPSTPHVRAAYGWDHALGFWIEVRRRGRLLEAHDALREAGGVTSVRDILDALVAHGFVTEDAVAEAMTWLPHRDAAEIQDPDVRRAAEVIERLRGAASEG